MKALEGKALSPLRYAYLLVIILYIYVLLLQTFLNIFYFSYATRKSPSYTEYDQLSSMMASRSPTPENSGKVTYITSFGDEEPAQNEKSKINFK